jgi:ketosteroid isomerase-like protein
MIPGALRSRGLLAVLVFAGCSGGGGPGTSGSSDSADGASARQPSVPAESDKDRLRAELAASEAAFERAVSERKLDGWVEAFAPNGMMVQPGGPVVGHEAIRLAMGGAFADSTFRLVWTPDLIGVSDDGTLGYTTGRYERRRVVDGEERTQRGSYFTVWRRQPDGGWLVEADMGTEPSSQPD